MNPVIKTYKPDEEYLTAEDCYITELSNSDDDEEVSIARARVMPGISTRWHRLTDTTERYIITEGTGFVEINNLPATQINVGDVVIIPPMCHQRITNTGEQALIFMAICTPRFNVKNYQDTQDQKHNSPGTHNPTSL